MPATDKPAPAALLIDSEAEPTGGIRLNLQGKLDGSGAYQLRDRLLGLRGEEITVDFSRLRESSDLALAILAMWLTENGSGGIRLAGMPAHASRILKAFGVSQAAA